MNVETETETERERERRRDGRVVVNFMRLTFSLVHPHQQYVYVKNEDCKSEIIENMYKKRTDKKRHTKSETISETHFI